MYIDPQFWTPERLQKGLERAQDELQKILLTTSKTIQGQTFQKQLIMDIEELISAYQLALIERAILDGELQDASVTKPFLIV